MNLNGLILGVLTVLSTSAYAADPFAGVRGKCKLGEPRAQCRSHMPLRELGTKELAELLNDHPFTQTHCFLTPLLKENRLVVWTDDNKGRNGWPLYVFASFSPEGKLSDLIGTHEGSTDPLLPGTYSKRVESISKGMNVTKMYELIGTRDPEYFQNKDGKWRVRFIYPAYPGQFYVIEADAATGMILYAGNGTI